MHHFHSAPRSNGNSSDCVPPTRRFRAPPDGYNVNAAVKGHVDGVSVDGCAPGAFAVAQRAVGSRPAWHAAGSRTDSMDGANSGMSYTGTSDGIIRSSTRSTSFDVMSTNSNQESEEVSSTIAIGQSQGTVVTEGAIADSLSHIPPEMRIIPRNERMFTIFSRLSRNSEDTTNPIEGKNMGAGFVGRNLVWILLRVSSFLL